MGWWSDLKAKASEAYTKVDVKVGGYLPGGKTPQEVKAAQGGTDPQPRSESNTVTEIDSQQRADEEERRQQDRPTVLRPDDPRFPDPRKDIPQSAAYIPTVRTESEQRARGGGAAYVIPDDYSPSKYKVDPEFVRKDIDQQIEERKKTEQIIDQYGSKGVKQKAYESGLTEKAPIYSATDALKYRFGTAEGRTETAIDFAIGAGTGLLIAGTGGLATPIVAGAGLGYLVGAGARYSMTPEQQRGGFLVDEAIGLTAFGAGAKTSSGIKTAFRARTGRGFSGYKTEPYKIIDYQLPGGKRGSQRFLKIRDPADIKAGYPETIKIDTVAKPPRGRRGGNVYDITQTVTGITAGKQIGKPKVYTDRILGQQAAAPSSTIRMGEPFGTGRATEIGDYTGFTATIGGQRLGGGLGRTRFGSGRPDVFIGPIEGKPRNFGQVLTGPEKGTQFVSVGPVLRTPSGRGVSRGFQPYTIKETTPELVIPGLAYSPGTTTFKPTRPRVNVGNLRTQPKLQTQTPGTTGALIFDPKKAFRPKGIKTPFKFSTGTALLTRGETELGLRSESQIGTFTLAQTQTETSGIRTRSKAITSTLPILGVTASGSRRIAPLPRIPRFGSGFMRGIRPGSRTFKPQFKTFSSPTAALFNIKATKRQRKKTQFSGLELIGLR